MPQECDHLAQYRKNKELLSVSELNINTTKYLDWTIVIMFYCAVHLIEKEFAKLPHQHHNTAHTMREKAIGKHAVLKKVMAEYHSLYMASRKARYDCYRYKDKDAFIFLGALYRIEKQLGVI